MSGTIPTYLIHTVQRLVNDEDNENFNEFDIREALKLRGYEARYLDLVPIETRASGGTITYTVFDAPDGLGYWGTDATLLDSNYDAITPVDATSDWKTGRWTFSSAPERPARILGWYYDVYAAAADLLEERAAQLSESYESVSLAHGSFSFSSKRAGPLELAREYRRKQFQVVSTVNRSDVN